MFMLRKRLVALLLVTLLVIGSLPVMGQEVLADEPVYGEDMDNATADVVALSPTPPPVTIPNHRLSQEELDNWIANYHARGGINAFELEVVSLVNVERAAYGLAPIVVSPLLMLSARFKAQSMSDLGYFSHTSPVYGHFMNIPMQVFGIGITSELIAMSHTTPQSVVTGWMGSPPHRELILSHLAVNIGMGFFNNHWAMKTSVSDSSHRPVPTPTPAATPTPTPTPEPTPTPTPSPTPTPTPTPGPSVGVSSWEELRAAVNLVPEGGSSVIQIYNSFAAHGATGTIGSAILIPTNRHITLVSSNTAEGASNVRTLTQARANANHFVVTDGSSLTLCQNILLSGAVAGGSGGVAVQAGGELIMNSGSVIENVRTSGSGHRMGAVVLSGSGTGESTRARLTMTGGTIRNNHVNAGSVSVGVNSILVMESGSAISNNTTVRNYAGSVHLLSETSVLEMNGSALISNNGGAGGVTMLGGAFTMHGGNIASNVGGGVRVSGGTFTMYDGSITGNETLGRGGVSLDGAAAKFTMNGGAIDENIGSGVWISIGAMTQNGGTINDNVGGGVLLSGTSAIFTMRGNSTISGNTTGNTNANRVIGAGVHVGNGLFTMEGGIISNNINDPGPGGLSGGGGVRVSGGVFNMVGADARIANNKTLGIGGNNGGGGIHHSGGTVNITAGEISGNSAPRGGGVHVSATAVGAFTMTGGSITDNEATFNGGGIYSTQANHSFIIPTTAYLNLYIGSDVVFSGNIAGNGWSASPYSRLAHIAVTSAVSHGSYPLNNYDINFTGRLGTTDGLSSWEELRAAINEVPEGESRIIRIYNSFAAGATGTQIIIPANRNITLVSSNTTEGDNNVRILTQARAFDRHFNIANGSSLTLCRNIWLSGGMAGNANGSGGIIVNPGGELIMNEGSVIENVRSSASALRLGAVTLSGSGTERATRAQLTMAGGSIRNNHGSRVGGVYVGANSIMVMGDDSVISNNTSAHSVAGGVLLTTDTSVFEMNDSASINNNSPTGGVSILGGTFTMYGGNITSNIGGGVRVSGGTFTMYDGSITGNETLGRGGVSLDGAAAKFMMNGGAIDENIGSGVWISIGTMTQNCGTINDNVGGGVSLSGANAVFTMRGNSTISGNTTGNTNANRVIGAGVHVANGLFIMEGGIISNNVNDPGPGGLSGGGGVRVSGGVFNMVGADARIVNNKTLGIGGNNGGGGIHHSGGTVNITAGEITGNSAPRGGGVHVSATAVGAFTMTGGSITDDEATFNGGGIYSTRASNLRVLPETAYNNLNIGPAVIFANNSAGNGLSAPPDNTLPHIATTNATRWGNPINNYDINYTGRLGQEHGVSTWAQLRDAINAAAPNSPTTIYILTSFEAPTGTEGDAIIIPADRQITLVSSNTTPGDANVRTISQQNAGQRHFIVSGSLTLGRNITLRTGANSGGVQVAGGTFIMGDGSDIIGG